MSLKNVDHKKRDCVQKTSSAPTIGLLIILLLIIFLPIIGLMSLIGPDYIIHTDYALNVIKAGQFGHISNILYHLVVIFFNKLFPLVSNSTLSTLAVVSVVLLLGISIFKLLKNEAERLISDPVIALLTISLLIISPIIVWVNLPFLMGYINPTIYHSPTQNFLRLFVVPVSLLALRVIHPKAYVSSKHRVFVVILTAFLVILATLSKPSYTITIIPGLCLYVIYRLIKRDSIDWLLLIFGLCLPAIGVVAIQYSITYINTTGNTTIAIGFLRVMQYHIPLWRAPFQFLLSLVFPISVYLLHLKEARAHTYLNFSWVTFLVGAGYTYFFYETGGRVWHGNFVWTSYSALFVLMFASLTFVIQVYRTTSVTTFRNLALNYKQSPWRFKVVAFIFVLHVLSGIVYYIGLITS